MSSRFDFDFFPLCYLGSNACVLQEVYPHALGLMTDVFGNYVIQKFFEHGTTEQRRLLGESLQGQVLTVC